MEDQRAIEDLVNLCREVGARRPFWIQGAGGNVSVKTGGQLYVKASGAKLWQVTASSGIAKVDLSYWRNFWHLDKGHPQEEQAYDQALKESAQQGFARPSMETGFHVVIGKKYVLHFHSLVAIVFADLFFKQSAKLKDFMPQGKFHANVPLEILGESCVILDSVMPGLQLSRVLSGLPSAGFYILRNHGVIVATDHLDGLSNWITFEQTVQKHLQLPMDLISTAALSNHAAGIRYYFPDVAVYQTKLMKELKEKSGDLDAIEILAAIHWIHTAHPLCDEIPTDLAKSVVDLPSEVFRKTKIYYK